MALPYNPWEHPVGTGALTGDIASFELNDESMEAPEPAEDSQLATALQVIDQQSQIINQLLQSMQLK